jgi:hypothetical protein
VKLTIEGDRETIKRYAHVKPARGWGVHPCGARCPGDGRKCTLEEGHRGPHVAHGSFKKVVAVWDADTGIDASRASAKKVLRARPSDGVRRAERAGGVLRAVGRRLASMTDSIEEIALIVFFLGMLGFVVEWAIMIVRSR